VVQDILPAGLTFVSTSTSDTVGVYNPTTGNWTIGALSSTTPAVLHILATVNSGLDNGTVVTNTANVTGGDTSEDSANNSSSAPVTVTIPVTSTNTISNNTSSGGGGGGGIMSGPLSIGFINGSGGLVLGTSTEATSVGTANSCGTYLTSYLRLGQKNDASQVAKLQTFLNNYAGAKLPVTGFFGTLTDAAVRKFQAQYSTDVLTPWFSHGLAANTTTGYVYKTTQRKINLIMCGALNLPMPQLP
jgi:hypothetical protein